MDAGEACFRFKRAGRIPQAFPPPLPQGAWPAASAKAAMPFSMLRNLSIRRFPGGQQNKVLCAQNKVISVIGARFAGKHRDYLFRARSRYRAAGMEFRQPGRLPRPAPAALPPSNRAPLPRKIRPTGCTPQLRAFKQYGGLPIMTAQPGYRAAFRHGTAPRNCLALKTP
jgi:hypothetical protein